MSYITIKERNEQIKTENNHFSNDGGNWYITLGAWRTAEFQRLLEKINTRDFDRLTLGELWLVSDLLDSIHDMGVKDD